MSALIQKNFSFLLFSGKENWLPEREKDLYLFSSHMNGFSKEEAKAYDFFLLQALFKKVTVSAFISWIEDFSWQNYMNIVLVFAKELHKATSLMKNLQGRKNKLTRKYKKQGWLLCPLHQPSCCPTAFFR